MAPRTREGRPDVFVIARNGSGGVSVRAVRGVAAALAVAVLAAHPLVASAQAPVTLRGAVDTALSQHPSVAAAQQALAAAEARLGPARAAQENQVPPTAQTSDGNTRTSPFGGPATTPKTHAVAR